MADGEIWLHEAPEYFFDPPKWKEFLAFFENRQSAVQHVSQEESDIFAFFRREVSELPTPEGANAQQKENIAERGKALVSQFTELLKKEEIIATGFSSVSVERERISAERWSDLWPNFIEDKAKGKQLEFSKVRVLKPRVPRTAAAELLKNCQDWMQKRSREGESVRKVLQREAIETFGPDLTTRIFGAAYKAVFSKSRGRPRSEHRDAISDSQTFSTPPLLTSASRPPADTGGPDILSPNRPAMTKLRAPAGESQVYTSTGHPIAVGRDGTIEISEEDAISLLRTGRYHRI
jgi:hypothetical protein